MFQALNTLLLPFALIASVQDAAPAKVEKWAAWIPQTYTTVLFESATYKPNDIELKKMRKALGGKVLLNGTLDENVIITAFASDLPTPRTSAVDYRKRMLTNEATFEVGDVACKETTIGQEGIQHTSWNAYLVAGTQLVDIHVSSLAVEGVDLGAKFGRPQFEEFVKTLRVISTRRLASDDLTPAIKDAMNEAMRAPDPAKVFEARLKEKPGDPSVLFARSEVMREFEKATDVKVKYCREALAAIEKSKDESVTPPLIRVVAIDALCIELQNSDKHAETIPLFEKAIKQAADAKPLLADLHYNLACSCARTKNATKAIAALKQSIALDPENKNTAAKDSDFESLRKNKEFLALVQ